MNNRCYRVIFSKAKGMLVVVSEATRSQGKSSNPSQSGSQNNLVQTQSQTTFYGKFNHISASILLTLGLATLATTANAKTQIIADKTAPSSQQATILNTANGKVQVNIQTPSAAGVSRNQFTQFDVDKDGAIVNNSRTNAQTRLAGWVEGNPWLATGSANVILNEINSTDPSHLNGYIEIAGQKADLIIANPAGIQIQGGGFINSNRTTLTTGNTAFNTDGSIKGFNVNRGNIQINGEGLSDIGSNYTQLISKTAQINAGIHAKNLDVITGENNVSYAENPDNTQVNNTDSKTNQTTGVSLDVSNLGGMYAGKIRLIGTDKGMGVTNAGTISASNSLQLDADGNLINTGSMTATKNADIDVHNHKVTNSGTIASTKDSISIDSSSLTNSGIINSHGQSKLQQTLAIDNTGLISAGAFDVDTKTLDNQGRIEQTGTGQLTLTTDTLTNKAQAVIGQSLYDDQPKATTPTLDDAPTTAKNGSRTEEVDSNPNNDTDTPIQLPEPITDNGSIKVDSLSNTGSNAVITANGAMAINANQTSNTAKSSITANRLTTDNSQTDNKVINTDSRIQLNEKVDWDLQSFSNVSGELITQKGIEIEADSAIDNTQGKLLSNGDVRLSTKADVNNDSGQIVGSAVSIDSKASVENQAGLIAQTDSDKTLNITATNVIANQQTKTDETKKQLGILANGAATLTADNFNNQTGYVSTSNLTILTTGDAGVNNDQGQLLATDTLDIKSNTYSNQDGTISADTVTIDVKQDVNHDSASTINANNLELTTQGDFSNTDTLQAQNLSVTATNINNAKDAQLNSSQKTQLTATDDLNNRGLINGSDTFIKADTMTNHSYGRVYGDHLAIKAATLNNSPDEGLADNAPVIAARQRLDLGVGTLNNLPNSTRAGKFNSDFSGQASIISNGEMYIAGDLDENHQATGQANAVNNIGATIQSVGKMVIDTDTLRNTNADWLVEEVLVSEVKGKRTYAKERDSKQYADTPETIRKADSSRGAKDAKLWGINADGTEVFFDEDWYEFKFNEVVRKDEVKKSDPSRIISGGDLTINGTDLINDKSQLTSGETAKVYAENLKDTDIVIKADGSRDEKQESLTGAETKYIEEGVVKKHTVGWKDWKRTKHENQWTNLGAYPPEPELLDTYKLPILNAEISRVSVATATEDANVEKTDSNNSKAEQQIRTTDSLSVLPNSSLYGINPDSNADYLVETDANFTNFKKWLSSDYMLNRLNADPNNIHKRLGDGYYEQQLVRDQIMALTGHYYLGDYRNFDNQYKALMDAGITYAQAYNLRPGIALTDAQIANLTTDIVWLVEQQITLADGSSQTVLAPKVYSRRGADSLDGTGNLIAAKNMDLNLTGSLTNQGQIVADDLLKIKADTLTNQNGGVIAGNYVGINTASNLNNLGSAIKADSAMALDVGGDLNNSSTTYHTESAKGKSSGERTGISQIASIYVGDALSQVVDADGKPLNTLVAKAGGDINFDAGQLSNQSKGATRLSATNINLNAINTGYQTNAIADSNNYYKQGESVDVGSQITGTGNIVFDSKNNITGKAINIASETGTVALIADKDILITEGRNQQNLSTAVRIKDKGLLSRSTTQDRYDMSSDTSISSNIEGNKVVMQAGNNIGLTATNVLSDTGVSMNAGNDLSISSAKDTKTESQSHYEKESGVFSGGGLSITIGKQQQQNQNRVTQITHTASNVYTKDGNLNLTAGKNYRQTGSNLIAGMGEDTGKGITDANRGNINVTAENIDIKNVTNSTQTNSATKSKTSGLTVSVSSGLVDSVQAIQNLAESAEKTSSKRMQGMAAVTAALKANALKEQALQAYKAADKVKSAKDLAGIRIQGTIGSQSSKSSSQSITQQNQASSIQAAGSATLNAIGNPNSQLNIIGSDITAGNTANLNSDDGINIIGSTQNDLNQRDDKSKGWAIGGYAQMGGSGGYGITASANMAKGNSDGTSTTHTNSHINSDTINLNSGGDTNIKGGVINANSATANIGGDLTIESLQDTANYESDQKNAGFSMDIDLSGGSSNSFSVNGGKTDIDSNYKAVTEQSGIFTQDGGFDIEVGGKTTLTGGAITTTEDAIAKGLNKFSSKGGIETKDLTNVSEYEGEAISAGFGFNSSNKNPETGQKYADGKSRISTSSNGIGYGEDSDSQTSVTKAGISGVAGHKGITTENQEAYAGVISNGFDENEVSEELAAQVNITQQFGKEAPKAVGDYANGKIKDYQIAESYEKALLDDLANAKTEEEREEINNQIAQVQSFKQSAQQDYDNWKEGGTYRVALHTAIGALGTGTVEGALTTGGVAASAPALNQIQDKMVKVLVEQGMDSSKAEGVAKGVTTLTLLGFGETAGLDTASTATAINVDSNNRQLHYPEVTFLRFYANKYAVEHGLNEEQQKHFEKLLFRATLYHIDQDWKTAFDYYIESEEKSQYESVYNEVLEFINGRSLNDAGNELYLYFNLEPTFASVYENESANFYLNSEGNALQATVSDYENPDIFKADAMEGNAETNYVREEYENSIAIDPSEISFLEGLGESIQETASGTMGSVVGVVTGVKDTVVGTAELAMDAGYAVFHIKETADKIEYVIENAPELTKEQVQAIEKKLEDYNNTLALYKMQGNESAIEYTNAKILGEMVGGFGVVGKTVKIVNKVGDAIPDVDKGRPAKPNNNHTYAQSNGVPDAVNCSFRGDMMVKTIAGFKPIEQIQIGELVWSRNQITGLMSYNRVLTTINSIDPDTAYVTITDENGNSQTIVSDSRHPYFGNYGDDPTPPNPSPEKDYLGNIQNAYWINAGDLEVGHKVLDDDGNWQNVTAVRVEQKPLNSYNLEVNIDHTFFIRGIGGLDGIWVHNKNCFDELPKNIGEPINIDGKDIYTFKHPLDESKTVKVILNPDEAARARGEMYVEVNVKPRKGEVTIKEPNKPTNTFVSSPPRTIISVPGSKGNWNNIMNNFDKYPDTTFKTTNGQVFKTDSQGRVHEVTGDLQRITRDRNGGQQCKAGGCDRASDDHGGHFIASMFNGPGEAINLSPMNKTFNGSSGKWYELEQDWKKALDKGQNVSVKIEPVYQSNSKRPSEYKVTHQIGKKSKVQVLKNTPTGE